MLASWSCPSHSTKSIRHIVLFIHLPVSSLLFPWWKQTKRATVAWSIRSQICKSSRDQRTTEQGSTPQPPSRLSCLFYMKSCCLPFCREQLAVLCDRGDLSFPHFLPIVGWTESAFHLSLSYFLWSCFLCFSFTECIFWCEFLYKQDLNWY